MTKTTHLPTNLSPVLRRTLELVRDDPRPQEELCARAGVGSATPYAWKARGSATLGGLEAMLGAMGYRLEVVPIENVARQRDTPNGTFNTPAERKTRQAPTGLSPLISSEIDGE